MGKEALKQKKAGAAKRGKKRTSTSAAPSKRAVAESSARQTVQPLFDVVKILDVSLLVCRAYLHAGPDEPLRLGVRRTARGLRSPDGSELRARVQFTLEGRREEGGGEEPVLLIEGTFDATYSVPPEQKADETALELFAITNGTFNLWPYWREFVQSMSARLGLPALTVPTYRFEEAFTGPGSADRTKSESA